MMIQQLDHIVILVDDLAQAQADYTTLGFLVTPGGEHAGGQTHNALVSFADGTYLELIAFKQDAPEHRWWRHEAVGEGLIDFALLPSDIEADIQAARERGLALRGPFAGGRNRPDGVRLEWQTAAGETADLPFFCADVTPRELRVPGPETWDHTNGVQGVAEVHLAVADLALSSGRYQALLNQQPVVANGLHGFQLGPSKIVLRSPGAADSESAALQQRLDTRGEGIFQVIFVGAEPSETPRTLDLQLSHGANFIL